MSRLGLLLQTIEHKIDHLHCIHIITLEVQVQTWDRHKEVAGFKRYTVKPALVTTSIKLQSNLL